MTRITSTHKYLDYTHRETLSISNFFTDLLNMSNDALKQNLLIQSVALTKQQLIDVSRVIRAKGGNVNNTIKEDALVLAIDTGNSVVKLNNTQSDGPAFLTLSDMSKSVGKDVRLTIIP